MKEQVTSGDYSEDTKARADLIELIFPQIVDISCANVVVKKNVKDWAFACGQMVGMLAGLGLRKDAIDSGIEEVMRIAKQYAHTVDAFAQSNGPLKKIVEPSADPQERSDLSVKLSAIKDIEQQAANEADPAVKAALMAMAHNMKRELKGDKVEDAA